MTAERKPDIRRSQTPDDMLGPCQRCAKAPAKYEWHFGDGHHENICYTCCLGAMASEYGIRRTETNG
jgi:hypothetical protein